MSGIIDNFGFSREIHIMLKVEGINGSFLGSESTILKFSLNQFFSFF